ncbi:hypothetical protein GCM10010307_14290 [Streptomyces vastus]|uniref:Uncharacterized protein n=1 Tax=Streptomyces vastus TaxID=285451 RepID=A0ABP6CUQ4_9ACTN
MAFPVAGEYGDSGRWSDMGPPGGLPAQGAFVPQQLPEAIAIGGRAMSALWTRVRDVRRHCGRKMAAAPMTVTAARSRGSETGQHVEEEEILIPVSVLDVLHVVLGVMHAVDPLE